QYFTLPHIIHMDSSGLHWTSLHILNTKLDSTGLSAILSTKLGSTGLDWTVNHIQHKTGLHWTELECQPYSTQNWTTLDYWTVRHIQHKTGLCLTFITIFNTKLGSTGLQWTVNYIAKFQQNVGIPFGICKMAGI
ncbi:hypothetical protein K443DRAFT_114180, partial [Laccaria amethystina LaAM-08-1]